MAIYLGTNQVAPIITKDPALVGWMENGKLIATKTHSFKLSDTNFSSITPTTSSQNLTLPATTYTTSPATTIVCHRLGQSYDGTIIDRSAHDYLICCEYSWDYVYTQSMTGVIHGIRTGAVLNYGSYKYYGIANTGQLNSTVTYSTLTAPTSYILLYQKADNTYSTSTTSYGICMSSASAIGTFQTNYINLELASLAVRGSDAYFPVSSIQLIKPADMTLSFTWKVYEGDKNIYTDVYSLAYSKAANPTT